jgi:hypothetical protein
MNHILGTPRLTFIQLDHFEIHPCGWCVRSLFFSITEHYCTVLMIPDAVSICLVTAICVQHTAMTDSHSRPHSAHGGGHEATGHLTCSTFPDSHGNSTRRNPEGMDQ